MYQLYSYDEIIRCVYRISRGFMDCEAISNVEELRNCYLRCLREIQPSVPINEGPDPFAIDSEDEAALSVFFSAKDRGDENQRLVMGRQYNADTRLAKIELARQSLDKLLAQDVDLRTVFDLVVHSVVVRPASTANGAHGGSSSAAIGVIWLAIGEVSEQDIMEILLHEMTHHLLYLDELANPQFVYDRMFERKNFATSAILHERRAICKVVHSMVVGIELVLARRKYGWDESLATVHPDSDTILAGIGSSFDSLHEVSEFSELTTAHCRDMLDTMHVACQRIYSGR